MHGSKSWSIKTDLITLLAIVAKLISRTVLQYFWHINRGHVRS